MLFSRNLLQMCIMSSVIASYPGVGINTASGDAEILGQVVIREDGIGFQAGDINCIFPFYRITVALLDTGQLMLTDPEQPEWQILAADQRLAEHPFLRHRSHIHQQLTELKSQREGVRSLKLASFFAVGVVGVILAVWVMSGPMVNFLAGVLPATVEKSLGDKLLAEIIKESKPVDASKTPEGLREIVARLSRAAPARGQSFATLIIGDQDPNARALPGGKILIHAGLFAFVETPEELAGVIAHEMAHITSGHGKKLLVSAVGPYYLLKLFISDRDKFASALSGQAALLVAMSYSRDQEREADILAWQRLVAANIDPRGMLSFFRRLDKLERGESSAPENPLHKKRGRTAEAYSTHPETVERIEKLEALWNQLPRKTGFADLTNLKWKLSESTTEPQ